MSETRRSIPDLLRSSDPLADDCCSALLSFSEETQYVDYKSTFDSMSDKAWLDLAIDCVAFANTEGGYIVFGVTNATWSPVGIGIEAVAALSDTKKVMEQVNKCLAPQITDLRTKVFASGSKTFVVAFIPPSLNATHIYESNRDLRIGDKNVPIVHKGAIYVRRVASNQVATAVDFEKLVARRIDRFRDRILEGMTRVVKADSDTEVITVKVAPRRGGARNVTVMQAPPELAISGRTVSIALKSIEDQISVYMALEKEGVAVGVPEAFLYEVYALRSEVTDPVQLRWLAEAALVAGAPAFHWLSLLEKGEARSAIETGFQKSPNWRREIVRNVSGFYGKPLYDKLNAKILEAASRKAFRDKEQLFDVESSATPETDKERATELAKQVSRQGSPVTKWQLLKLDCSIYAPF